MTGRDFFRFELFAEGGVRRWRVLAGEVFSATLEWERGSIGSGCEWRLYSVSSPDSASRGFTWPRGEWITPRGVPIHIRQRVIEQLAAWSLEDVAEAARVNALLRSLLESSGKWLESYAELLRTSCTNADGDWDSDADLNVYELIHREIVANKAALARTRTQDKEAA